MFLHDHDQERCSHLQEDRRASRSTRRESREFHSRRQLHHRMSISVAIYRTRLEVQEVRRQRNGRYELATR